jgi:phosphatidylserine decarboxylase
MDSRGFIAREGYPFILIALAFFMVAFVFRFNTVVTVIFFIIFIFVLAFFRDPHRPCLGTPEQILSPADGKIVAITHNENDRFLGEPTVQVGIFMSPFNVHINRAPVAGSVRDIRYNPGEYFNAASEKASLVNEQNALIMDTKWGSIAVNQIAGFIARRIVCRIKPGAVLKRGERFGLIRFGSRVDLHLPPGTEIQVEIGDRVYGGDTILGVMKEGSRDE